MVNAVGYLGFEHQAITHLTGTTTLLGGALAQGDTQTALHLGGVAFAFLMGAAISGMIVQDSTLQLGRRYGVTLVQTAIDLPILDSRSDRMRHLAMRCLSRPLTSSGT